MIISASRRTDIPAFYPAWFLNRIQAGEVLVRNPFNAKRVSRVSLAREHVDYIHFWTKNPAPLLKKLDRLNGYDYCFHFTINGYGPTIEPHVPQLERLLDTFCELSLKCPVAWRYCPILISPQFGVEEHLRNFTTIANALKGYTDRCHISMLDEYKKIKGILRMNEIRTPDPMERELLIPQLVDIAARNGIRVISCSDHEGLSTYGVIPGQCLDPVLMSRKGKEYRKDPNQRPECLCCRSVDIGAYGSCPHDCIYCYANRPNGLPSSLYRTHDSLSPLITGNLTPVDIISEHKLSADTRANCTRLRTPTLFDT